MTVEMNSRLRCAEQVHARRFDAEMVIVDLARGEYFSLDEIGGAMWDWLVQGLSLTEVAEKLAATYDADLETIRSDTKRIAGELVSSGLLVVVGSP
jgi:hypothetical protein